MKVKRLFLLGALILLAALLSACGGTPAAATWPGLAADSTAAYLADGSIVYAVRLKDGAELWRFPAKADSKLSFYSNPVFTSDGQLLVGSSGSSHTLYRIDPQTGQDNWSFSDAGDHWEASPLVVGNMAYAPNVDGFLYAFDMTQNGANSLAWKVELGGKLWSQPVTDGKRLYVASLDHHIYAVDIQTHEIVWTTALKGAVTGNPTLSGDKLYVGSFGAVLDAINTSDGSIAWSISTKGWLWSGPAVNDGVLYFGDLLGNFYSINAADGKPAADTIQPDPNQAILATPLITNGQIIFVSEAGVVYSLTPGGKPLSLEKMNGKLYTAPVVAGDLILVAPFQGDSLLVALDQAGKQVWVYPTPAAK